MAWTNEWKSAVLAQPPSLSATTLLPLSHTSPQEVKNFALQIVGLRQ